MMPHTENVQCGVYVAVMDRVAFTAHPFPDPKTFSTFWAADCAATGVNPAYSSQTCASCGHVAKENRKSQAEFECVACGHTNNADINAAQNLLLRAFNPEQKITVAPRCK